MIPLESRAGSQNPDYSRRVAITFRAATWTTPPPGSGVHDVAGVQPACSKGS
jgi:hypothetical protein